jgi:hypothetical protein
VSDRLSECSEMKSYLLREIPGRYSGGFYAQMDGLSLNNLQFLDEISL